MTNQLLPVQRSGLVGGIASFYTGLHGVSLRQTRVYHTFMFTYVEREGYSHHGGKGKSLFVTALGTGNPVRCHVGIFD